MGAWVQCLQHRAGLKKPTDQLTQQMKDRQHKPMLQLRPQAVPTRGRLSLTAHAAALSRSPLGAAPQKGLLAAMRGYHLLNCITLVPCAHGLFSRGAVHIPRP